MFVIQYTVANLMLLLLSIWMALAARDKVRRNGASLAFIDIYNVLHQVLGCLWVDRKKCQAIRW